ncbi:hypothetical protein GCM10010415_62990 [Streptomyces atrovirens]
MSGIGSRAAARLSAGSGERKGSYHSERRERHTEVGRFCGWIQAAPAGRIPLAHLVTCAGGGP